VWAPMLPDTDLAEPGPKAKNDPRPQYKAALFINPPPGVKPFLIRRGAPAFQPTVSASVPAPRIRVRIPRWASRKQFAQSDVDKALAGLDTSADLEVRS
jgi:hypothetical protein